MSGNAVILIVLGLASLARSLTAIETRRKARRLPGSPIAGSALIFPAT